MTGIHYVAVALTFCTGMFAGAMLSITSFAPTAAEQQAQRAETRWEIVAQTKGSCAQLAAEDCASFSLASDRQYRFLENDAADPQLGKVTAKTNKKLAEALATAPWESFSGGGAATCAGSGSGSSSYYTYDITYLGDRYQLATCSSVFKNSVLANVLETAWEEIIAGPAEPVLIERGIRGFLEERLDEEFDYDDQ